VVFVDSIPPAAWPAGDWIGADGPGPEASCLHGRATDATQARVHTGFQAPAPDALRSSPRPVRPAPNAMPLPQDDSAVEDLIATYLETGGAPRKDLFAEWLEQRDTPELDDAAMLRAVVLLERCATLEDLAGLCRARPDDEFPMSAFRSVESGTSVGPYVLGDFIARGGMGEVWEAHDTELAREVALKLVLPDRIDPRSLERFAREGKAGSRALHKNLVTTFAYGRTEHLSWIAQELVPGAWTLKHFIDDLRRAEALPKDHYRRVADLVAQIADGLEAAHAAGVIHRDVKPSNILIAPDGTPKVTDFGLARVTDDSFLSVSGEIAGTLSYMSPEQVAAKRVSLDRRTDVFSLGVVLYELLTLRRPFEGDTTHQIASKIATYDPPDARRVRSQCPRDLAVICGKALEKTPDRRYERAAGFAADLRRHLADEAIVARPPGRVARGVKWARRHRVQSAVAAVGFVALVIISVFARSNSRLAQARQRTADHLAERVISERKARLALEEERETVRRLSSATIARGLMVEQAALWPPYPRKIPAFEAWLDRAADILRALPRDADQLAELRAAAPIEDPTAAQRHPDYPELERLRKEYESKSAALAVRRGEAEAVLPQLDMESLPEDPVVLGSMAALRTRPTRVLYGEEGLGTAIATEALERVGEEPDAMIALTIHQAYGWFALGDDTRARKAAKRVADLAERFDVETGRSSLSRLREMIDYENTPAGRAETEADLRRLAQRIEALEVEVEDSLERAFASAEDARLYSQLSALTTLVEPLRSQTVVDPPGSDDHLWTVAERLQFARNLEAGLAPGRRWGRAWTATLEDLRTAYPDLELDPVAGLVPLGRDPDSGLFEFGHLASGELPKRGSDGRLVPTPATGIVLVLVTGGEFLQGAQAVAADAPNFDPDALENESMVHPTRLSPYLIGKYEVTIGQWERLTHTIPTEPVYEGERRTYLRGEPLGGFPVTVVSWNEARTTMAKFGLQLPTEAQWEFAARAGGVSLRPFGAEDWSALSGRLNAIDRTTIEERAPFARFLRSRDPSRKHEDPFVLFAPVGHFDPNDFGLHDMCGNVTEWCRDLHEESYSAEPTVDPIGRGD
jgi:formylglycine-generating enzyme required for sulfatase activity